MTGADFTAAGQALARAYALIRPDGPAWLATWQAGDAPAADELSEWELEGHPFHPSTWSNTDMMTVTDVLDGMLAAYAVPHTESLEAVLHGVIGDPDEEGIPEAEWRRRCALVSGVSDACGVDLAAFGDLARRPGAVVAVLRAGRAERGPAVAQ